MFAEGAAQLNSWNATPALGLEMCMKTSKGQAVHQSLSMCLWDERRWPSITRERQGEDTGWPAGRDIVLTSCFMNCYCCGIHFKWQNIILKYVLWARGVTVVCIRIITTIAVILEKNIKLHCQYMCRLHCQKIITKKHIIIIMINMINNS